MAVRRSEISMTGGDDDDREDVTEEGAIPVERGRLAVRS
jgi:hypothetical protein